MNKWNDWYQKIDPKNASSFVYGDTITYELGYNFLKNCKSIEDWGCGTGGFKRFIQKNDDIKYIGIDGSITPFADIQQDLTIYKSKPEGIFMRHVLEHNYEWEKILNNACGSFQKKNVSNFIHTI